jgi:hypothetical protein
VKGGWCYVAGLITPPLLKVTNYIGVSFMGMLDDRFDDIRSICIQSKHFNPGFYLSDFVNDDIVAVDITDSANIYMEFQEQKPVAKNFNDFPGSISPFTAAWYEIYLGKKGINKRMAFLVIVYLSKDKKYICQDMLFTYELNTDRRLRGWGFFTMIFHKNGEVVGAIARPTSDNEDYVKVENEIINRFFLLLYSIQLINCKNIILKNRDNWDKKLQDKRQRKGKKPLFEYKIMSIDPLIPKKRLIGEINPENEKRNLPLHIVRGHPITFTADRPAFGYLTGTYFFPMHKRGNKDNGFIKKDYRIRMDHFLGE